MTVKQMYDEILRLEKKLNNTTKRYGITDPDKRAELQARVDYLKNAYKEEMFSSKNAELGQHDLSSKLELDETLGYGKGVDLPEKKEIRFTPIKRTDAQRQATANYDKLLRVKDQIREAARKAAKEVTPENDMYKVRRKYQLPFYLKKAITAIPKGIDGPLLAKIGAGLAGGVASLASEAALEAFDAESLNNDTNANRLLDIEEKASKFDKELEKTGAKPYRLKPEDLIDPNVNTPSFIKLRDTLKSKKGRM